MIYSKLEYNNHVWGFELIHISIHMHTRERERERIQQTNIKLDGRPSLPPVFSMFCVAQSSVFFCLVLCRFALCFFFGHCTVCPSIYGFSLPLWYLQTFHTRACFAHFIKKIYWTISGWNWAGDLQDFNSTDPGEVIGIKLNFHITMLLRTKYNFIFS